jgi:sec-independent protein translocase protein TatC
MSKEQEADRERLEGDEVAASEEPSSGTGTETENSAPADQPVSDDVTDAVPDDDAGVAAAGQEGSSSPGVAEHDGANAEDSELTGNSPAGVSPGGESSSSDASSTPKAEETDADIQLRGETEADKVAQQPKDEAPVEEPPHEMTFTEHLNELRVRLVRCLIAAFVGFLACYGFAEQLFMLLMQPLIVLLEPSGGSLIYTGLPEAFFTHLKVAALAGLFVASPYVFYQIWMFIAPGLYEGERKYMIPIALCSALCFVTGALFGYFIVFPFGFQFFLGYASEVIRPMPSVKEYFSFSTSMLFAFGLIFELPLFMFFLSVLGVVNYKSLRKYRKFAILGSFVVAAILTPPDVVSQSLMAGPMCLLYEVGIWVSYMFGKKPPEPPEEEPEASQAKA